MVPGVGIIIRAVKAGDGAFLARLSRSSPISPNAPPATSASCEDLVKCMRKEQLKETVIKKGKVVASPKSIDLVIISNCDDPLSEREIRICGYSMTNEDSIDGVPVRSGYVQMSLNPNHAMRTDIAQVTILYLLEFAFHPVSQGGLQLDLVRFAPKDDDLVMLGLIKNWLYLSSLEKSTGSLMVSGEKRPCWELSENEWKKIQTQQCVVDTDPGYMGQTLISEDYEEKVATLEKLEKVKDTSLDI